jgi:hypothetical protein
VRYYFECKTGAISKIGFTSYKKCFATIHVLAYGIDGDIVNEYMCTSETA